mmetsp:Transcript_11648/g.49793  ORF Transcript_11648/g.49793 Transcript_11648/m.49793 type:complete len:231 (+) Transcript_11648:1342-2034(+)
MDARARTCTTSSECASSSRRSRGRPRTPSRSRKRIRNAPEALPRRRRNAPRWRRATACARSRTLCSTRWREERRTTSEGRRATGTGRCTARCGFPRSGRRSLRARAAQTPPPPPGPPLDRRPPLRLVRPRAFRSTRTLPPRTTPRASSSDASSFRCGRRRCISPPNPARRSTPRTKAAFPRTPARRMRSPSSSPPLTPPPSRGLARSRTRGFGSARTETISGTTKAPPSI